MKQRLQAWGDSKVLPITSVFVFNDSGELLLLKRHADDLGGDKWGLPGGRIEPGESMHNAAQRELFEETGIHATTLKLLGTHKIYMPHGTVHLTCFTVSLYRETRIQLDLEEHSAFKWFTISKVLNEPDLLWGVPTLLHDFHYLNRLDNDPTLSDGSHVQQLSITAN